MTPADPTGGTALRDPASTDTDAPSTGTGARRTNRADTDEGGDPMNPATPPRPIAPIRIRGFGGALPTRRLTNHDLTATLDTSDEWITTRTGIRARHHAETETTTSLALDAGRRALSDAGLEPTDLDLIVVATTTPDSVLPSTAARVAAELGTTAGSFDLNGACTGFIHALLSAAAQLTITGSRRALVVGADRLRSLVDPTDRNTAVLFGDGAGAVVIESTDATPDGPGILATHLAGDPSGVDILEITPGRPFLTMDGPELFRRAVRALVDSGRRVLNDTGLRPDDVDLYLPHQANIRIVQAAANRIGIPENRVVYDMAERANTSAASIPLALESVIAEGRLRPGGTLLLSGIGAGLGWGSLLLRWQR